MRVNEIFRSINGEVNSIGQGSFCTFIRLAGCSLRCSYCDTEYAQDPKSGREMSVEEIITEVKNLGCRNVTITGGEPLDQRLDLHYLLQKLWFSKHNIVVETNGHHSLSGIEYAHS